MMRCPVERKVRGWIAALGCRLVALFTMLSLLAPSMAWAATPYSVVWVGTNDAGSCATPVLAVDGSAMFGVNKIPLPTYEVPGALMRNEDGSQRNIYSAKFDSVLLLMGANDFHLGSRTPRRTTRAPTRTRW